MAYCTNCGNQLSEGAKFCERCGIPTQTEDGSIMRQDVYEGTIHKCPNCGEIINAFTAVCPSCGYQFRSVKQISSVRELSIKLEIISARRMPEIEKKSPFINVDVNISVFGSDQDDDNEEEARLREARKVFEEEKKREMSSLIINFVVPNTIEDILEFMLLAESNIKTINNHRDIVEKAWMSKMEQVNQKAELSMQYLSEYKTVSEIYLRTCKRIKNQKVTQYVLITASNLLIAFLTGLFFNWKLTIVVTVILLFITIVTVIIAILIKKKHNNAKEDSDEHIQ